MKGYSSLKSVHLMVAFLQKNNLQLEHLNKDGCGRFLKTIAKGLGLKHAYVSTREQREKVIKQLQKFYEKHGPANQHNAHMDADDNEEEDDDQEEESDDDKAEETASVDNGEQYICKQIAAYQHFKLNETNSTCICCHYCHVKEQHGIIYGVRQSWGMHPGHTFAA